MSSGNRNEITGTKPALVLLCALVAIQCIGNVVWMIEDTRPPRWDESYYMTMAMAYVEELREGDLLGLIEKLVAFDRARPPFVPMIAALPMTLLGANPLSAELTNQVALAIVIFCVYAVGSRLRGKWTGLLAAALCATYPGLYFVSRVFLLDMWHSALIILLLHCAIKSRGFRVRGASLAAGVVAGCGMICRAFFPLFAAPSLAYLVWEAVRGREKSEPATRAQLRNLGLFIIPLLLVAGPWYAWNLEVIVRRSASAAYGAESIGYGPQSPLALASILTYASNVANLVVGLPGMIAAFLALMTIAWSRLTLRNRNTVAVPGSVAVLLLASAITPMVVFGALPAQDFKNLAPALPPLAVATAIGVAHIGSNWLRRLVPAVLVTAGALAWWLGSFGIDWLPKAWGVPTTQTIPPLYLLHQGTEEHDSAPFFMLPLKQDWQTRPILDRLIAAHRLESNCGATTRPPIAVVLPSHPFLNADNLTAIARMEGLRIEATRAGDPHTPLGRDWPTELMNADMVLVKSGSAGPEMLNTRYAEMSAFVTLSPSLFEKWGAPVELPDGSEATIYVVRNGPLDSPPHPPEVPLMVSFGNGAVLTGITMEEVDPGGAFRLFRLTLLWSAPAPLLHDDEIFLHITPASAPTEPVGGWDHPPAAGRCPMSAWPPGKTVVDRGLYELDSTIPPGTYSLRLGILDPLTGSRRAVASADPGLIVDDDGSRVEVLTFEIEQPLHP